MRARFSDHALTRLRERGLSPEWILKAVASPDFAEADPGGADRKRAFKRDGLGRLIRIVYDEVPDAGGIVIVTAMPDRNRGRQER